MQMGLAGDDADAGAIGPAAMAPDGVSVVVNG
jgi:hypothetical protein